MVIGNMSGAREALERALSLREDYVPAMAALGYVLLKQGDVVRAERLLKMAYTIQPDHEFALVALSEAQCMTGQAVEAYRLLEAAVKKNPFELALWIAYYEASRHTQSVQCFEEDVRRHLPGNSSAMFVLARLCYDQMRYIEAEDNLRRLWPHHHPYHVAPLLGKLYVRLDMLERAVEHYQEAIRYNLNGEALREFAHVLFATGRDTWARAVNIVAEDIEYGREQDALLTDMEEEL
jgi:tetratricopeptide (TPR) repeat protein